MNKAPALLAAILSMGLTGYAAASSGSLLVGAMVFVLLFNLFVPMFL